MKHVAASQWEWQRWTVMHSPDCSPHQSLTEIMVGRWLDSHHFFLVSGQSPEFSLFIFPILPSWPPSTPAPLNIRNAIMDQWAPPSVALLVNIYRVEQQPLPSPERGALQSLGAILCVFVCVRVCICAKLFPSFQSPLSCCERAGTFHRHEHVEVQAFTALCGAVLSVCLSLCSVWGSSFDKGI